MVAPLVPHAASHAPVTNPDKKELTVWVDKYQAKMTTKHPGYDDDGAGRKQFKPNSSSSRNYIPLLSSRLSAGKKLFLQLLSIHSDLPVR